MIYSLEDFLVNATARYLVFLEFIKDTKFVNEPRGIFDCPDTYRSQLAVLEQRINDCFEYDTGIKDRAIAVHGQQYKFKGVDSICVNAWNFSLDSVTSQLNITAKKLNLSPNISFSVVIPVWREIVRSSSGFFYRDLNLPLYKAKSCNGDTIPHSQRVQNAAEVFLIFHIPLWAYTSA